MIYGPLRLRTLTQHDFWATLFSLGSSWHQGAPK